MYVAEKNIEYVFSWAFCVLFSTEMSKAEMSKAEMSIRFLRLKGHVNVASIRKYTVKFNNLCTVRYEMLLHGLYCNCLQKLQQHHLVRYTET